MSEQADTHPRGSQRKRAAEKREPELGRASKTKAQRGDGESPDGEGTKLDASTSAAELEALGTEDQLFEEALHEAPTEPRHALPSYPPEAGDSDWDMPTVPDGQTLDVHAFDDWDPDERG